MHILLFAGYLIADLGTTAIGIRLGFRELNPVAVSMGITQFMLIKVIATIAVVLLVWRIGSKLSPLAIRVLTLILAVVTLSNSLTMFVL
jgi:hypothetical protein